MPDPLPIFSSTNRPANLNPGTILILSNGQIWKITDGSYYGLSARSEEVIIYNSGFSYVMSFQTSGVTMDVAQVDVLFSDNANRPANINPGTVITTSGNGLWVVTEGSYYAVTQRQEDVYVYQEGAKIKLSYLESGVTFSVTEMPDPLPIFSSTNRPANLNPGTILILSNGQIWKITNGSYYDPSARSEEVIIYNSGSSYVMSFQTSGVTVDVEFLSDTSHLLEVSFLGNGVIVSSPVGINCGSDCSENYSDGTSVQLNATPDTGYQFEGWSGACSGTGICTILMTQDQSVHATFSARVSEMYTLSVSKSGLGSVTTSPAGIACGTTCSGAFESGTTVTLSAIPVTGAVFTGWGGACSGTMPTCTLDMNDSKTVLANFGGQLPEAPTALAASAITTTGFQANWEAVSGALGYRLDVATDRAFTQSVANYWDLDTGNTQSFTVSGLQPGIQYYYRVRAYNDSGQGTASNTIGARTTSLASAPTLTVTTTGRGTVTSSPTGIDCGTICSTTFTAGTQITLSATPESGATFIGWSGACSGTTSTCTIDLTTSQQVSAAFSDSATDRDAEGWRVTEIYIATLGYAPDNEGLQYWNANLRTGGWTPLTVAQSFFDQPLVEAMYPADQGYGPFIEALYQNLFGRAPDQAGYDYWLGDLESGRVLRNQMIVTLIEAGWTNPDAATDMARFGHRVQVGLAFAAEQAVRGILYSNLNAEEQARLRELGAQVLEGVTADESTRDTAILAIPDLLDTL
jgi:uncharacterized repeat protein (TIGR02543 family)